MDRPTKAYAQVKAMLGSASGAWEKLIGQIRYHYEIDEIWAEGKPTHKHHNNLYFKRGGKALATLAIREGYFLASITLGAKEREKFDAQRAAFGEKICKEYDACKVLHDGLWIGFEIRDDMLLVDDFVRLMHLKRKPNRKILPKSLDACGQLDIGLSHEEITQLLL